MGGAVAGIGEALRSTRERRGLSIAEVAQDTRISPRFLEALEAEQFDELPAPVYVRGFIRSYASYLKIESQPLLDQLVGGIAEAGAPAGYVGGNGRTNGATTTRSRSASSRASHSRRSRRSPPRERKPLHPPLTTMRTVGRRSRRRHSWNRRLTTATSPAATSWNRRKHTSTAKSRSRSTVRGRPESWPSARPQAGSQASQGGWPCSAPRSQPCSCSWRSRCS